MPSPTLENNDPIMTMIEPQNDSAAKVLPVITNSLDKVEAWVEDHNYKGYEPFDGLSSWFRPLTVAPAIDPTVTH
jgi:hypothetical protein